MNILVVDDNKEFCDSVSDVLELEGYSATCAYDAPTALARVEQVPRPDVVLLDMVMPGIEGLETLRRLKIIAPKLPVIMVSGFSLEDRRGTAVQEGLYAFVRKPIDFPRLFALIENCTKAN